jgi:nucleotide-binding universal stress UspA family protein
MKAKRTSAHVVAAVDGSRGSRAAVTYAAREARDRGLPLELVNVVPAYLPAGPFPMSPEVTMRDAGYEVLQGAHDVAVAASPGLEVTTTLLMGSRVDALVRHTRDAALLVAGAAPHGLAERLWTGSIVTGLAARATCPFVIVPSAEHDAARFGRIVVGLKSTTRAEHLLGTAFAVARQSQSDLVVIHAWHLLSGYDDAIAERIVDPEWATEQRRMIEDNLIDLRMAYPDVQVEVELVHGQPAYALVTRSTDADLLLISRPPHGGFVHYLGATARAVIRDAACPIEVVPPLTETPHVDHADIRVARQP